MKCDCRHEMWSLVITDLKELFSATQKMKGCEEDARKQFMPGMICMSAGMSGKKPAPCS
jgi:hypothetical protein